VVCLVTGGCGFVGSALVRHLLAAGHEVVVVDDLSKGSPENLGPAGDQVTLVEQDVTAGLGQILASYRPDTIYHLAAVHFIPDCDTDPLRCLRVNVEGTRAVLEAAAALGKPMSVVLASSAAVYAPADWPHHEDDSLGPIDVYGYSKRWAEELARSFGTRTGMGVGIARLFNVYGPGETNPHFIPSLISQIQAGEVVRLGNLSSKRDYVFVDDVAEALIRLARYCGTGQSATLNVGTGTAYSGHEVVRALSGLPVISADPALITDPSRIRPVDRPSLQANNNLAQKVLGWVPDTSFEGGLQAAWERPAGAGVISS
jgi:UDP-glucose 4-epimerase